MIGVAIPYRETSDARARALACIIDALGTLGAVVQVGRCDIGRWSKGAAVQDAVARLRSAGLSSDAPLIVHDADVLADPNALLSAASAVSDGVSRWAVPHGEVHRYNETTTDALIAGVPFDTPGYDRAPYWGMLGGGIVVTTPARWDTCPLDGRFLGWGSEDQAWGWAMTTLYGEPWRADTYPLIHLWHEHADPGQRRNPDPQAEALRRAYSRARNVPRLMRAVIAGTTPDPPTVFDEPVCYQADGVTTLNVAGRLVRFPAQVWDGDIADVLDVTRHVERVAC